MRERLGTEYSWTARQKEVLELLSNGRTNPEIAEALGISRDGAKYHVNEILSKLGSNSRDEAAEYWRRYNGLRPRFGRVFRSLFAIAPLKWGAAMAVTGGAAFAVVIVLVLNQGGNTGIVYQTR